MKKTPKKTPTPAPQQQCRALMVSLVLETVDATGEVLEERITPAQKVLRAHWPNLPSLVAELVDRLNAARTVGD